MNLFSHGGVAPATRLGGRFVVERPIGRGASGIVYRAFDEQTQTTVALKVIATRNVDADEEARFVREGRVLADLHHPGVVRLVAFGTLDDGLPYVAMEWLDGEDVAARVRQRPLTMRQSIDVAWQVAEALAAAHTAGVVHRDVKPTNIFLVASEGLHVTAKLLDFGVAAVGDVRLTQHGAIVGTPAYMAPEQARGEGPVDVRSDLYSLGATLFEMLTGRPPHVGPTPIATLARLVTMPAARLGEFLPSAPRELDELVARMLAIHPHERPATAELVARALKKIADDPSVNSLVPPPLPVDLPLSTTSASGSRLVTSIVALFPPDLDAHAVMAPLKVRGAEVIPLGHQGIIAHFGVRQSLGDEALRALEAGKDLARRGARVGIATGRARLQLSKPVGDVVERATGLAREADLLQLLVDATTAELVRGWYVFQQRGDGSAIAGDLVVNRRTEGLVGGAPFVGREAELAQVLAAYDRCIDDTTPVVVSATGPPGIGKTRLSHESLTRIAAGAAPPRLAIVRCESFGRAQALGAAAEVLRALLRLNKGGSAEAAALSVADVADVAGAGRERDVVAQLLADEPLHDDPGARDALWLAMTDVVLAVAKTGPVAIVLEDAQWADPESMGWLDHVLSRATFLSLWLLVLTRPPLWREHPHLFLGRDHVRLEMRPISKKATRAIARALLGDLASEARLEQIVKQAAGSPLFAEELARLTAAGRDTTKAPTIEAAIQVSLDGLEEPLYDALTRFSVFGLTGWQEGLVALGVPDAIDRLHDLAAAEFVVERAGSQFEGAREWAFKHALVREVAYASLGPERREQLHADVAAWLETMGEDATVVARHYELGGRTERAAYHWERAARRALAAHALTDAVSLSERALTFAPTSAIAFERALLLDEALARLDPRAAERETAIRALVDNVYDEASEIRAAGARARYDDARGAEERIAEGLADVCTRAARLHLTDEETRCRAALASRLAFAGRWSEAEDEARRLLATASQPEFAAAAIDAWQTLAIIRQTRGELLLALDARRSAARAAADVGYKEREAMLTVNLGFALTTLGARDEARATIEQGIAIAQSIGTLGALRQGNMVLLGWAAAFGSDERIDEQLGPVRAEADAAAGGQWAAPDRMTLGVLFYRGLELLSAGRSDDVAHARRLLKTAAETYRATGMRDVLPVALGFWAEAERRCGHGTAAVQLATEAGQLLEAGAPSLLNEAPVYLTLHDAQVDEGNLQEAKAAIACAMPALIRRVTGLRGSPYVVPFLAHIPSNAGLVATAEAYGLIPPALEEFLSGVTR